MTEVYETPYIYSSIELRGTSLAKIDLTISSRNTSFTIEGVLWNDVLDFIKDLQEELKTMMEVRDELRGALNDGSTPSMIKTPANDIQTAITHHEKHGDMDGKTCLLNECALHYPKTDSLHREEIEK